MKDRLENIILGNLLDNDEYFRKVLPFLKPEYFSGIHRILLNKIQAYSLKYNKAPTKQALAISIGEDRTVSEGELPALSEWLENNIVSTSDPKWLLDETEKYCKDKAIYNAIMEGIQIIDGKNRDLGPDALPDLLSKALQVGFDNNIGHDYIQNADKRYEFYHKLEEKMPFDLAMFNEITEGGLANKTLNVALAGTGVGKSLFMCHMAANAISQGKNVLYITLEMSEERIAERIDANLMNLPIGQLKELSKQMFEDRISKINAKIQGRLIVKEYPTASAHSGHFKALINELKLKRNFAPDIIFIDYLNICSSSRFKSGSNQNSYTIIKSIAEELRGLAVEEDLPIVTATQTTRGGYNNSDVELTDTSESFGLPATADLMFALISTEELEKLGQIMVKQLKNRYSDITRNKRFMIGVDRSRMKLFDIEGDPQEGLVDSGNDTPVFDKSSFARKGSYDEIKF
jgi:archaellum biogenesis ATPase FlaH